MKLNKEWHLAHRMPKYATLEQRIAWHIEHKKIAPAEIFRKRLKWKWCSRRNSNCYKNKCPENVPFKFPAAFILLRFN